MDKIKTIYLASKSPRRYKILSRLGIEILLCPLNVEEITNEVIPERIVCDLALLKIQSLAKQYPERLIVSCDTIVWHEGRLLGKPKDESDAYRMLSSLSGGIHSVYSGYAVSYMGDIVVDYSMAQVKIKTLASGDIIDYIKTGSPMDKAGAYGVQDGIVVKSFCGDYDTIVGMPLDRIVIAIDKLLLGGRL